MDNTIVNQLIIQLANLNHEMNAQNKHGNVQQIFKGVRDKRDTIIDRILIDEDVYSFCEKQSNEMNRYYKAYGSDICFVGIVDILVRMLLKNFILFPDTKSQKGYMLSYCFRQEFGAFKNRVWGYFNRYSKHFEEMKDHVSIDKIIDNESYSDMQDYFQSNKFDMEFHQSIIGIKDHRSRRSSIKKNYNVNGETMGINNYDEETRYVEDDNGLLLNSDIHPTVKNAVITSYDIPYETLRLNNKYILLSDEEYSNEIDKIRRIKLKRWNRYKNESAVLPYDVTKYKKGINPVMV